MNTDKRLSSDPMPMNLPCTMGTTDEIKEAVIQFFTNELEFAKTKVLTSKALRISAPLHYELAERLAYLEREQEISAALGDRGLTYTRVAKVLHGHLNIELQDIEPTARIGIDLGADSLDGLELVMAFEEEFNMYIEDSLADPLLNVQTTVAEIVEKLELLINESA